MELCQSIHQVEVLGSGSVANVTNFGIIDSPIVNWVALDDIDGSDTYGSIIGDFSASIVSTPAAIERCGEGELFAVIVTSESEVVAL